MNPQTLTVFRRYRDNEIIALFPYEPHDRTGVHCVCYVHHGQHGAADPATVIRQTKPAQPHEYEMLERELERIGYHLNIRQRIPADAYRVRRGKV